MKKNIMIFTTQKCNMKCSYCINDKCKSKDSKHFNKNMLYKIDNLSVNDSYDKFSIGGGEPGLLKNKEILLILEKLNKFSNKNTRYLILTNRTIST